MPAAQSVHVDRLLTAIVIAYMQSADEFIAPQVFPIIPVEKEHDAFGKYDKSVFFRRPTVRGIMRAPGAKYVKADFKLTTDNFQAQEYGLEFAMDSRTQALGDPAFDLVNTPTQMLTMHVLREREIRVKNIVTDTTKVTSNVTLAGSSQWSDTGSNPTGDVETGCRSVLVNFGVLPNLAVFPFEVWQKFKYHPDVLAKIQYKPNQPVMLSPAGFFDIFAGSFAPGAKLLIPIVIYDTSVEGQTFSSAFLWGKDVLIAYVNPSAPKEAPAFGNLLMQTPPEAVRYRDESINSDVTRVREIVAEKLVDNLGGYLIKAAVP